MHLPENWILLISNQVQMGEYEGKKYKVTPPLIKNYAGTNFADKRRLLGRYSSLADQGHGVIVSFMQPLTEMSTRSRIMFLGSRARPVRKINNLTAICEPIIWTVWDLQHLTTL
jgi:hypothetical protein